MSYFFNKIFWKQFRTYSKFPYFQPNYIFNQFNIQKTSPGTGINWPRLLEQIIQAWYQKTSLFLPLDLKNCNSLAVFYVALIDRCIHQNQIISVTKTKEYIFIFLIIIHFQNFNFSEEAGPKNNFSILKTHLKTSIYYASRFMSYKWTVLFDVLSTQMSILIILRLDSIVNFII